MGLDKNFNYYCNLYNTDKGDKGPNGNHYANWYDLWFSSIREDVKHICEIGVENGGSAKAMEDYFPNTQILGLDILDKKKYETDRISTRLFDQENIHDLNMFVRDCQESNIQFDIIIDDGSHDVKHQQMSFGKLFHLVKPGGLYILEDMGTSYLEVGSRLYGFEHTPVKAHNHTVNFLTERPFSSVWIDDEDLSFINENVDYVSIFDRANLQCTYINNLKCKNNYQIRSITSIIKKKDN